MTIANIWNYRQSGPRGRSDVTIAGTSLRMPACTRARPPPLVPPPPVPRSPWAFAPGMHSHAEADCAAAEACACARARIRAARRWRRIRNLAGGGCEQGGRVRGRDRSDQEGDGDLSRVVHELHESSRRGACGGDGAVGAMPERARACAHGAIRGDWRARYRGCESGQVEREINGARAERRGEGRSRKGGEACHLKGRADTEACSAAGKNMRMSVTVRGTCREGGDRSRPNSALVGC